ncbi:hypothetical protein [Nostoc sp. GT001]|uniref:hypothetical protein n=1 Tax=Nostoc sp. GT001 TaxID=3056647 RepID=UPI0025AAB2F7|nr:hypothetical protein [Nostoc sp. GT001]MDM9583318.1 hypothetical protein [Nostoc sp. GT001]
MQIAKLLKKFWRWVRLFLISRLDRPSDNLVVIIISLIPLILNWDLNWSSKIIFEFDLLNKIIRLYFYITPLLLFINSFLFKENLLKFFSIIVAGFVGCFILFVFLIQLALGNHINLVERVECPNGKIFSVYENFEPSFLTSDDAICRFELQQDRIFIGVIKNIKEVGEKKCQVNTRELSFQNRLINTCTR